MMDGDEIDAIWKGGSDEGLASSSGCLIETLSSKVAYHDGASLRSGNGKCAIGMSGYMGVS